MSGEKKNSFEKKKDSALIALEKVNERLTNIKQKLASKIEEVDHKYDKKCKEICDMIESKVS